MTTTSDNTSLIHFSGPLSDGDRARLRRLLHRVEAAEDFPSTPFAFGRPWVVAACEPGLISISRIQTPLVFAADSTDAVIRRIEAWLDESASGQSNGADSVS